VGRRAGQGCTCTSKPGCEERDFKACTGFPKERGPTSSSPVVDKAGTSERERDKHNSKRGRIICKGGSQTVSIPLFNKAFRSRGELRTEKGVGKARRKRGTACHVPNGRKREEFWVKKKGIR